MEVGFAYKFLRIPYGVLALPDLELFLQGVWANKDVAGGVWVSVGSWDYVHQEGLPTLAKAGFSQPLVKLVHLALYNDCTWLYFDRTFARTEEPRVCEVAPWDD